MKKNCYFFGHLASSIIISAAFSAIIIAGAFVLPPIRVGIIEASTTLKFLIPLTIILIPGFLALFYALVAYLFVVLKPKENLSSFFLFSLTFGIVEFLRGSILTGFPWNLIAYSFYNQIEILNITSIIGTYSFNLFCISLFASTSFLILRDNKKEIIVCILFFLITFILDPLTNISIGLGLRL